MKVDFDIEKALKTIYIDNPCKTLPNSLWKTIDKLSSISFEVEKEYDEIVSLIGWDNRGIYLLWNKTGYINETFIELIKTAKFMIIHNDYLHQVNLQEYRQIKTYFRLKHDKALQPYKLDKNFYFKDVCIKRDCTTVSAFISNCYKYLKPSPEAVQSWTAHRVFDRSLWLWIIDKQTDNPAALGIAEIDKSVPEGSLEWIQVLPKYQGRGLGKSIVNQLLERLYGRVEFTTVSGEFNSRSIPERMYRSCGFHGKDVWWLLRK